MDRLDAMRAFLAAIDEGSLSGAARRLGRSPAALTRAIAFLESELGVELLHRTTRSLRPSEAGEGYAAACRRILADLDEADLAASGARAAPQGLLTVTAPVNFGTRILRPVLDDFLAARPLVRARFLLLDRQVQLVEEGVDVALRIGPLPDSRLIARKVGAVSWILAASPRYLAGRSAIAAPDDLAGHDCIVHDEFGESDAWSFHAPAGGAPPRRIRPTIRLSVNSSDAMMRSAVDGHGIVRVCSYQIQDEIRDGRLVTLLPDFASPPLPVHLLVPEGRLALAKVRAFVDFATDRLRRELRRHRPDGPARQPSTANLSRPSSESTPPSAGAGARPR
ncbi:MAG: LysR family transcriptional regulator [Methylobacterium frigidaeris]